MHCSGTSTINAESCYSIWHVAIFFAYMQGAWYFAKYEAVVRANSVYSSPAQQSDHSIRRVGLRMEKLDNASIQD